MQIAKKNSYINIQAILLRDIAEVYKIQNDINEAKKYYLLSKQLYEAMDCIEEVNEINKKLEI